MNKKPYRFASGNMSTGSCVLKITYDDKKYVIAKCKQGYDGLKRIENGLNAFISTGNNNPAGIYFHLYNYVKKHPHKSFKVEVLLETDNVYQLLVREQEELYNGMSDRRFMNNQTEAYIPAYDETKTAYGWIPTHAVLNFKNWMKKNKPPVKRSPKRS